MIFDSARVPISYRPPAPLAQLWRRRCWNCSAGTFPFSRRRISMKAAPWPDPRDPPSSMQSRRLRRNEPRRNSWLLLREIEIMFGRTITRETHRERLTSIFWTTMGWSRWGRRYAASPSSGARFGSRAVLDVRTALAPPCLGLSVSTLIAALPPEAAALTKLADLPTGYAMDWHTLAP